MRNNLDLYGLNSLYHPCQAVLCMARVTKVGLNDGTGIVVAHPEKNNTRMLNNAKKPFSRRPATAIQGLGSFRRRLIIPKIAPVTDGTTRSTTLIILSLLVDMPTNSDSNRVSSQSIVSETRNRINEIGANLVFISNLL
jgi:hypothetical protein